MPPDSSYGFLFSKPSRPVALSRSIATGSYFARSILRMSICSMTFASTSRQSSMIDSWNTMPTSVCGRSTRLPPTLIVPAV